MKATLKDAKIVDGRLKLHIDVDAPGAIDVKVFCPNGPGGGVDPTCSPPGGSSIDDDMMKIASELGAEPEWEEEDWSAYQAQGDEFVSSLSSRERAALTAYRDQGQFKKINQWMRAGGGKSGDIARKASDLHEALSNTSIEDGVALYRGMALDEAESGEILSKMVVGAVFTDDGFLSASPSFAIASGFVRGADDGETAVLFKMRTKKAKGVYISNEGKEPEHLLQSGAMLRIKNVQKYSSGLHVVEAEVTHERD